MTVPDQLSGRPARWRKTQAKNHVVQTPFQLTEQVLTCNAFDLQRFFIIIVKLLLQKAVNPAYLLFLTQLDTVFRQFEAPRPAVLARRKASLFYRTFWRETFGAFEKKLLLFAAT
jgi:hypothetical protein